MRLQVELSGQLGSGSGSGWGQGQGQGWGDGRRARGRWSPSCQLVVLWLSRAPWAAAHYCIAHRPEHITLSLALTLTRTRTRTRTRTLSLSRTRTPLLVVTRRGDLDEAEIMKKAGGGK